MICSSEGRLFEYASDNEIQSNLEVLREFPEVLAVVGSVTRADEPIQRIRQMRRAATRPRGLEVFRTLIEETCWKITRAVERPFSDQVVLACAYRDRDENHVAPASCRLLRGALA